MAIFHYTVKIVGRSKGKSIISASAYLNGDVMKNEETGRISYYTAKREVVYTSLLMCENAPQEWLNVPAENIRRFQKSVRYKRADNKEAALKKFKLTFQKQRLWNEVLRIEKSADAQLGRSFEFSLPKEWNRQEQIDYTTEYIQKTFVNKGMCADWSIHDKGDGNMSKPKIAFICVHNSCRSQIAEAFGKVLAADVFESYSAGTETKPQINQDAVRLMKELYGIDMEKTQYSKLISAIPKPDIAISMGCNVSCPFIGRPFDENWGLDDPTGKSDDEFKAVMEQIRQNVLTLKSKLYDGSSF